MPPILPNLHSIDLCRFRFRECGPRGHRNRHGPEKITARYHTAILTQAGCPQGGRKRWKNSHVVRSRRLADISKNVCDLSNIPSTSHIVLTRYKYIFPVPVVIDLTLQMPLNPHRALEDS